MVGGIGTVLTPIGPIMWGVDNPGGWAYLTDNPDRSVP